MDDLKQEHERNESRIHALESRVQQATSPPVSASSSPVAGKSSNGSSSHQHQSIASALFNRSKPKSKSKSKSKSSSQKASSASLSQLNELEREVMNTRDSEMNLVSNAIGISPDGQELNENGEDDVLDLADQLLAQLDARIVEEEQESGTRRPPPAPPSSHPGVVAPVPIPGTSGAPTPNTAPAAPMGNSASSLHHASSSSSSSSSSHSHGLGHTLKKVFSPNHTQSDNSSARQSSTGKLSDPAAFAAYHDFSASPASQSLGSNASISSSRTASPPAPPVSHNHGPAHPTSGTPPPVGQPKQNRHQLRKERKQAADDQMRAEAQAEVEAMGGKANDPAEIERIGIEKLTRELGLHMVEMEPDGNCMYHAIADQLVVHKYLPKADYHLTRSAAAAYMRSHMDDFLPYLPAEDEEGQGEGLLSPEGYTKHCDHVENTSEWGSETEILAISKYYKVPIHVVQANSPIVKVGNDEGYAGGKDALVISYHKRQYGCGEHYNSLRPGLAA